MCVAQGAGDLKNYVKHKIYTTVGPHFVKCVEKTSQTISHIVSQCEKLAQKEYKRSYCRKNSILEIMREECGILDLLWLNQCPIVHSRAYHKKI